MRQSGIRATVTLCALTAMCEGFDLQAAGVAAAGLTAVFNPSTGELGLFFSGGTIGLFLGALLGGRLADSIGRRRVLIAAVALFGLMSLTTALAWDMSSLVALRILTGVGLGGALPILLALVAESAAEDRRNSSVAAVYAATPLGGAIVSAVSFVVGAEGWRWIFVIGGVAPIVLALVMGRLLAESSAFLQLRAMLPSGGTIISDGAQLRPGSFAALFTQGRAMRTLLLWTSFFLGLLTLFLLLSWLPILLHRAGFSETQAAIAQIGFNLGGALAALLAARLFEGATRRPAVVVVFTALPLFLYLLALVPAHFPTLLSVIFVLGCAVLAAQAFLYATAPSNYPTPIRGVGVGAAVAVGRLGSVAGPLLGGLLIASGSESTRLLASLLPLAILASALAIVLAWLMPSRGVSSETSREYRNV